MTRVTSLLRRSSIYSHGVVIILDIPSSCTCLPTAIMFTIKATYRSETRKFTFPDSSFPTYNQIHEQVFPSFFITCPHLTPFPSFSESFLLAPLISSLVFSSHSLLALLLPAYSSVWKPAQKKSMSNMSVLSVAVNGLMLFFVSS